MRGLRNSKAMMLSRFIGSGVPDGIGNALTTYSEIEHIWQMAWRTGFYRGGPVFMSALSGIDIALWDLKGTLRKMKCDFFCAGAGIMLTSIQARNLAFLYISSLEVK